MTPKMARTSYVHDEAAESGERSAEELDALGEESAILGAAGTGTTARICNQRSFTCTAVGRRLASAAHMEVNKDVIIRHT
jgi:hypothetical protein